MKFYKITRGYYFANEIMKELNDGGRFKFLNNYSDFRSKLSVWRIPRTRTQKQI